MATTFVLTRPDVFVSGTVAAYVKPALGVPASGAPSGSAVSSPSVVGNSVTFTGLADNTQYIAYQGTPDRYVSFRTTPASTAVSETDPVAGPDLVTHAALTTTAHGGVGANLATHAALTTSAHGGLYPRPARGTVLPAGAADLEFFWDVDATNHVTWHMIYDNALSKWLFLGGPPLYSEVLTSEGTTSTTYVALTTAGPSIALPGVGGGLYMIGIGSFLQGSVTSAQALMSYDIGGTGAVDADYIQGATAGSAGTNQVITGARLTRKTIATQLTLTAKYKVLGGSSPTATFKNRWMSLLPVQVNPS